VGAIWNDEAHAQANGGNIRVDLVISWPAVLAVSIAPGWTGFREGGGRGFGGQNAEKSPNPRDAEFEARKREVLPRIQV